MKTTIALDRVQDWMLVGLKPMHRAILRNQVQSTISRRSDSQPLPYLSWHTINDDTSTSNEIDGPLWQSSVVVVDRDWLTAKLQDEAFRQNVLDRWTRNPRPQIRLLWSWTAGTKNDMDWCTELGLHGVLFDSLSLQCWCRVAIRSGLVHLSQSNPILSGIQLPTLATTRIPHKSIHT
jgi:hypothetical protein